MLYEVITHECPDTDIEIDGSCLTVEIGIPVEVAFNSQMLDPPVTAKNINAPGIINVGVDGEVFEVAVIEVFAHVA